MSWPGWIRASAAKASADTDGRRERPARAQADEAAKYLSLRERRARAAGRDSDEVERMHLTAAVAR